MKFKYATAIAKININYDDCRMHFLNNVFMSKIYNLIRISDATGMLSLSNWIKALLNMKNKRSSKFIRLTSFSLSFVSCYPIF